MVQVSFFGDRVDTLVILNPLQRVRLSRFAVLHHYTLAFPSNSWLTSPAWNSGSRQSQSKKEGSETLNSHVTLTAADGHQFDAYVAGSNGPPHAAIVLIQEIFGVNQHIRSVADDYAAQGFHVIAPALFDRAERNLELTYEAADMTKGMNAAMKVGLDAALKDVAASIHYARSGLVQAKVGVLGYCFGGTLAWLAATRLDPDVAVGYYGGRIAQFATETPRCPVMLHFGSKDPHIPASEIAKIKNAHPDLPLFMYDAGHGFNCDQRRDYNAAAATLARERTLDFLRRHLCER